MEAFGRGDHDQASLERLLEGQALRRAAFDEETTNHLIFGAARSVFRVPFGSKSLRTRGPSRLANAGYPSAGLGLQNGCY